MQNPERYEAHGSSKAEGIVTEQHRGSDDIYILCYFLFELFSYDQGCHDETLRMWNIHIEAGKIVNILVINIMLQHI